MSNTNTHTFAPLNDKKWRHLFRYTSILIIIGLLTPCVNSLHAYSKGQVDVSDLYLDVVSSFGKDVINISADEIASMLSAYNEKLKEFGISANHKPTQAQSEILLKYFHLGKIQ